jgi:hypothetical protein
MLGPKDATLLARELQPTLDVFNRMFGFELRTPSSDSEVRVFKYQFMYEMRKHLAREQRELQNLLLTQMIKTQKAVEPLLFALWQAKDYELLAKMRDRDPLVRWFAADILSRKQLHVEKELIGLLKDPLPEVREAARQALVRIARGTDFGPNPLDSPAKIEQAIERWTNWLAMQDQPTVRVPNPRETVQELLTITDPGLKKGVQKKNASGTDEAPLTVTLGGVKAKETTQRPLRVRGPAAFRITGMRGDDDELRISTDSQSREVHELTVTLRPNKAGDFQRTIYLLTDIPGRAEVAVQVQARVIAPK